MLFEKTPAGVRDLLPVPIKKLGLKLEGSQIERYVEQLFKELESKGLKHFRPAFYLTSEWGCPSEQPVIGVPFYLADPRLGAIELAREVQTLAGDEKAALRGPGLPRARRQTAHPPAGRNGLHCRGHGRDDRGFLQIEHAR